MTSFEIFFFVTCGICLAGSIATNLYTQSLLTRCHDMLMWMMQYIPELEEYQHEGTSAD